MSEHEILLNPILSYSLTGAAVLMLFLAFLAVYEALDRPSYLNPKNLIGFLFDFIQRQLMAHGVDRIPEIIIDLANLQHRRIAIYSRQEIPYLLNRISIGTCETAGQRLLLEKAYLLNDIRKSGGGVRQYPGGYVIPVQGDSGQFITYFRKHCSFLSEDDVKKIISAGVTGDDEVSDSSDDRSNGGNNSGDERGYRN